MKKQTLLTFFIIFLSSCATINNIDWSNSFWGRLESEDSYLYKADSLTSVVHREITKGSVLYFHNRKGDFREVYLKDPRKIKEDLALSFRYYLYKPSYRKVSYDYSSNSASLRVLPFDQNRTYITGERGGCYYINKYGNKTYVEHSYCQTTTKIATKPKTTYKSTYRSKSNNNSKCSSAQCTGRTKKGTRCRNRTTNCSRRCYLH